MNKIEDLLVNMESLPPFSKPWLDLEDEFLESLEELRSPKLKASYVRRYVHIGENDQTYTEKSFKELMASFREEIPEIRERLPFLGGLLI